MFSNVLRRLPQGLGWRLSTVQFQRNATGKEGSITPTGATDVEAEELMAAEMFDNSLLKHKPVVARELLQRQKATKQNKPASSPASTAAGGASMLKKRINANKFTTRTINDEELGLQYVRLASEDPQLSTLMTTARSRIRRNKNGQIVLEGRRLIREALECQLHMHALIFSQTDQLQQLKDGTTVAERIKQSKLYKVPHHDLKMWSTLSTPPGLLAIFERPTPEAIAWHTLSACPPLPITVVCDNVREPNNLGSIIRTCAALPCKQVVVTRGCCDPWESKALRGGCGGHFRVPILDHVDWENVPLLIPPDSADDCCVFVAENNREGVKPKVSMVDYADVKRIGAHNVVLIGGESHGVSEKAYEFLNTVGSRGKCLHIPLANGVDSLNVASALTLILYELRKHLPAAATAENSNM